MSNDFKTWKEFFQWLADGKPIEIDGRELNNNIHKPDNTGEYTMPMGYSLFNYKKVFETKTVTLHACMNNAGQIVFVDEDGKYPDFFEKRLKFHMNSDLLLTRKIGIKVMLNTESWTITRVLAPSTKEPQACESSLT